jgi:hypothetical protein
MRAARATRLVLAGLFLMLAVFEPDPVGRTLACVGAFLFVCSALVIPRGDTPYIVATEAGLESRYFGLLTWDEVAAIRVRQRRRQLSLEIYDRNRKASIRRARPRLLQIWMILTQPFHLPLLRITEWMASFDAVQFRAQLEQLAGRTFPDE